MKKHRRCKRIRIGKIFAIVLVAAFFGFPFFPANAETATQTLAETINTVASNVDWTDATPFTSVWGIILSNQSLAVFDEAINQNIARGEYISALNIARLAELNNFSSNAIIDGTRTALMQLPMCGSLPITFNASANGDPDLVNQGCFLIYNRFLIWAYKYAEERNLTGKWDKKQAFADFARLYNKPPTQSSSGEMLLCDPEENWARSYSSRYFDEHAETLSVFLKFHQIGVQEALTYADSA